MNPELNAELITGWRKTLTRALADALPSRSELSNRLLDASRYALLGGGKRLRPLLTLATCHSLGASTARAEAAAVAVEMIHSYSLVHDDLPAMDDDELRHGKASCHVAYDEATAVLVGDGLQARAFEVISQDNQLAPETRLRMIHVLAAAAGVGGMVGGQAMDMASEGQTLAQEELERLHRAKTGALLRAAIQLGALAADATATTLATLDRFGASVGLAFQVTDDVLDVTQSTEVLGKPSGSDEAAAKATYPALLGLDAAQAYAERLLNAALAELATLNLQDSVLATLGRLAVQRSS